MVLQEWENFAVITGSAAGALTGVLVAVAISSGVILTLQSRPKPGSDRGERGRLKAAGGERRPRFSDLSAEDQLYWLAAAVMLALGGGVINAWLFLTRAPAVDAENKKTEVRDAG